MSAKDALPLLRLALSALDRDAPNVEMARGILREVVGAQPAEAEAPKGDERAVSIGEAAQALAYSTKHLRTLISSGRLDGAVIGSGRATRVIVSRAIELLGERRASPPKPSVGDAVEAAGAAYVRRSSLRVV